MTDQSGDIHHHHHHQDKDDNDSEKDRSSAPSSSHDGDDWSTFKAGDHVTLACQAGVIPYDHHAIVLRVQCNNSDDGTVLTLADFTADGADGRIASSGTFSGGGDNHHNHTNNDNSQAPSSHHGLRILTMSSRDPTYQHDRWRKVDYDTTTTTPCDSHPSVVLARVAFLYHRPYAIPLYSLVESNCECVAVWCKTGLWQTLQLQQVLGRTHLWSRVGMAAGAAAVAVVSFPLAVPVLAVSAVGEVASGWWKAHAQHQWHEQTRALNDAFVLDQSIRLFGRRWTTTHYLPEYYLPPLFGGDKDEDLDEDEPTDRWTTPIILGGVLREVLFADPRSLRAIMDDGANNPIRTIQSCHHSHHPRASGSLEQ